MKKLVKDALILLVITLLAGLFLGVVYEMTKGPIEVQKERTKKAANLEVFPDAVSFETDASFDNEVAQKMLQEAGLTEVDIIEVAKAFDEDMVYLGAVLTVTSHEGYSGDITFTMGIQKDGSINGISILSIAETAGLGMKANTDGFKNQFSGVNTQKFEYTKSGATADNQIDAISGATITTNAITNGVNAGLVYFHTKMIGGGQNE